MDNQDLNLTENTALSKSQIEAARKKARAKRKALSEDYNIKMPGANIYGYDDLGVIMKEIAKENPEFKRFWASLKKDPAAREKLKSDLLAYCKSIDERKTQNVGAEQPT